MNLLLLSNSTTDAGYLTWALPAIRDWAGGRKRAVFVPYAGVVRSWDDYAALVQSALADTGIEVTPVHRAADPAQAVRDAELVLVGGGNTFHLLHHCRRAGLLPAIAQAVRGGMPYLGWSAGSNLACPTICTTNDMPIIDPGGFDALGLVPFQLNPHYTNALPAGLRGETRNQRIAEFTRVNPSMPVLGLPEGNWVRVEGNACTLHGPHPSVWFYGSAEPRTLSQGPLPLTQQD
jgi:dipeptidase E